MKRVAAITGSSGGIGAAAAALFSSAGWRVVGIDREGRGAPRPDVDHFIEADVSLSEGWVPIVEAISREETRLDALVNNAAIQVCKPLLETSTEDWDLTFATNVRAAFLAIRHAFPLLKASAGAVVNVASVHALATSAGLAAYGASKGALVALTRAAALELALHGIRVNAVLPGAVDTAMLRAGLGRGHLSGQGPEALVSRLGERHAMGRVGRPEEIGRVILFLADNTQSSFMTGQTVVVDGGATARLSTE